MSDEFDEKADRFEKLWDGITPKGENRIKALKFRQYMRNHVLQSSTNGGRISGQTQTKGTTTMVSPAKTSSLPRRTARSTGWESSRRTSETLRLGPEGERCHLLNSTTGD